MKKTWGAVISTLAFVLFVACAIQFLTPLFGNQRTYSETNCLTDQVTTDMDVYDIAKLYRDGGATVAVKVYATEISSGTMYSSLGSGVCVASNGYTTSIKVGTTPLSASRGSYIVTNHHVIEMAVSSHYSSTSISIITEKEEKYNCSILWANKNLDVAILYCDNYNLNYVSMKDIIIDCDKEDLFDYQQVFAIGCPLDERDYLNRLTVGNIATNDVLTMYTAETVNGRMVMSNMYEDVVDIAVGITSGNSGGGCFDKNGYLIGLTTLGTSESVTAGNQMNGMVGIYPVMTVLDRLIENNEANGTNIIYTLSDIGLYGIDANEASIASSATCYHSGAECYYLNGEFYATAAYTTQFKFGNAGYQILKNDGTSAFKYITSGIIISCEDDDGRVWKIEDRNDLIYFLLNLEKGDVAYITLLGGMGTTYTRTISL